jgi:DNA-binding CsgD family transcriptional regulator
LLLGRRQESASLHALLDEARSGQSATIVLRGDAGVGKTALLDDLSRSATDVRLIRTVGVESEMELPFAALQLVCAPILDLAERIPSPQRLALATALGLESAPAPDRYLVGLAVLSLFSEATDTRPLLCIVDDAQWLDRASAQVLAFAARRLLAESVLLVFATRETSDDLAGLPELFVAGLHDAEARELLSLILPWPFDERIRERLLAEARGNPLALLELPRGLPPADLAGGYGLPGSVPLSGRMEESFLRRMEHLSHETMQLLTLAAAEPIGDWGLVSRAAKRIGMAPEAIELADAGGLVDLGGRIVFRHPLVRSAIYGAASAGDRRKLHAALADETDPELDPDRRSWHRARATAGPDEDVAEELELSASRAQARGGLAAAAAFLERAAELTVDPSRRARRAVAAARAKHEAGAPEDAIAWLAAARGGPLDELERAQMDLLRAEIAYSQNRGSDAPPLLLSAARRLERLDIRLARDTYHEAIWAAHFAGRLARGAGILEIARAALSAPRPNGAPLASDLLLDGMATALVKGYPAGVRAMKQAVKAYRSEDVPAEELLRWSWPAAVAAMVLWDDESFVALAGRHVQLARETGALTGLPIALSAQVFAGAFVGDLATAGELIQEMKTITEVIGSRPPPYGPLIVAAWRGNEDETLGLADSAFREAEIRGEGAAIAVAHYALAVLSNSLGRYDKALSAAKASYLPEKEGFTISNFALVEIVEAALRTGARGEATDAADLISQIAQASGADWARGIHARSQALIAGGDQAESYFREALEKLGRTKIQSELARTRLLYGEFLRRENRRVDAREQLRLAHEMFTTTGANGFAERARRELLATGETVRKRTVETLQQLTAQENQIARLAADGRTNPEIGAELFISARTVEWHLRKVYPKLGISSRRQLSAVLANRTRESV